MSLEKQAAVEAREKDLCLTSCEKQVIALVVAGYVNKEIALRLGASEQEIKQQITAILDKLGVANRLELVLFVLHHRLIDCDEATSPLRQIPPKLDQRYAGEAESVITGAIQKGFPGL